MKKITAVILSVVLCLAFSACGSGDTASTVGSAPSSSLPSSSPSSVIPSSSNPSSSEPSDISSGQVSRPEAKPEQDNTPNVTPPENTLHKDHLNYTVLSDIQKVYYEAMHTAVENMNSSWIALGPHTEKYAADIAVTRAALVSDHPEIFWLPSYYITAVGSDAEGGKTALMMFSSSPEVSPAYSVNRSEKAYMAEELKAAVESIAARVTGTTPFEIELQLHDILCDMVEYSDNEADGLIYTAYGALVGGKALCEGYSRAMQLLLSHFGIYSTTVSGVAEGEGHMWNIVNIDGEWYHLDVTWNDLSKDTISHEYFNITDSEISLDHTFSKNYTEFTPEQLAGGQVSFNILRPSCTALDADYFVKQGFFFTPDKMLILAELLLAYDDSMVEVKFADSTVREDFVKNYNHYFEELNAEIMLTNPDAAFYVGRVAVSSLTMRIYKTEKDSEVSESFLNKK